MSDDTSVPGLSGAVCCGSATAVNLPGFPAIGRTGEDAGRTRHGLMGEVARGWGGLGLIRIVCAGTCHAAELQRVLRVARVWPVFFVASVSVFGAPSDWERN